MGWGAALLLLAGVAQAQQVTIEAQDSGTNVRLRGISAVDANTAWASGREGTVLRTIDGGKTWAAVSVPDAKSLDFRDIEAFDANTAVVLSIGPGEASRVYRTEDAGKTWALTLQNKDERAFFDCMAFDGGKGWMLGDPVDGNYEIRKTIDGGRTWSLEAGPPAGKDEAAFAASGTCIAIGRSGQIVTVGGGAASNAWVSHGKRDWRLIATPMLHRVPAGGIFSAAGVGKDMLLVGGDFEHDAVGAAARIRFTARGPEVDPLPAPRGYRSGAACRTTHLCIAVGPTGVDRYDGRTFSAVSDIGYDAVDLAGDTGWASGDQGRIARIVISSSKPKQASP